MILMSAGLNAGMTGLPNRDFEVSPSGTPNRDLDGTSRVMKIGPEESILRKKQVSPHKIGEHCRGLSLFDAPCVLCQERIEGCCAEYHDADARLARFR